MLPFLKKFSSHFSFNHICTPFGSLGIPVDPDNYKQTTTNNNTGQAATTTTLDDDDNVETRPMAPSKPPRIFSATSLDLDANSRTDCQLEQGQEVDVQESERRSRISKENESGADAFNVENVEADAHGSHDGERVLKQHKKKKRKKSSKDQLFRPDTDEAEHVYAVIGKKKKKKSKKKKSKDHEEPIYEVIKHVDDIENAVTNEDHIANEIIQPKQEIKQPNSEFKSVTAVENKLMDYNKIGQQLSTDPQDNAGAGKKTEEYVAIYSKKIKKDQRVLDKSEDTKDKNIDPNKEISDHKPSLNPLASAKKPKKDKKDVSKPLNPKAMIKKERNKPLDQPVIRDEAATMIKEHAVINEMPNFRMAPASTANVPGTRTSTATSADTMIIDKDGAQIKNQVLVIRRESSIKADKADNEATDEDLIEDLNLFSDDYVEPPKPKVRTSVSTTKTVLPKKNSPKKKSQQIESGKLTEEEEGILIQAEKDKADEAERVKQVELDKQEKQKQARLARKSEEEARLAKTKELKIEKNLKAKATTEALEAERPTTEDLRAQLKAMTKNSIVQTRVVDDLVIDEDDDLLPIRHRKSSRLSISSSSSTLSQEDQEPPTPTNIEEDKSGLVMDYSTVPGMCMI
jgi:hypothetical protein